MKPSVSAYQIEESEILRKAYQLLAYFLANQQIARIAHPDKPDDPLKALEARFLYQETSTLLLEVAILFRSLDDQLKRSTNSAQRKNYLNKVANTNERRGGSGWLDSVDHSLSGARRIADYAAVRRVVRLS
jgi:hypothetical protein